MKKPDKEKGLFVSASALAIAKALHEKFPKDAAEIVTTMEAASTNASTTHKLARVRLALVFLQSGGAR